MKATILATVAVAALSLSPASAQTQATGPSAESAALELSSMGSGRSVQKARSAKKVVRSQKIQRRAVRRAAPITRDSGTVGSGAPAGGAATGGSGAAGGAAGATGGAGAAGGAAGGAGAGAGGAGAGGAGGGSGGGGGGGSN